MAKPVPSGLNKENIHKTRDKNDNYKRDNECFQWKINGSCTYGDTCRYSHDMNMDKQKHEINLADHNINNYDIKNYDLVIGPLTPKAFNYTSKLLKNEPVLLVSPLSKVTYSNNVINSITEDDILVHNAQE
mgnify:CR=1 FL=1